MWPSTQLGQSTVCDDGRKPGRHLCRSFELIQVPEGRQERILHRILSVVWIPHVAICSSVKDRQIPRNGILELFYSRFMSRKYGVILASNVLQSHFHLLDASASDSV